VSISTQVQVSAGGSVSVPVNIAAGSGINLFSFTLTYDAAVVDVQGVQLAPTAGLGVVDVTDVVPGTLSVVATLLQPMTAGGAVVNINFNAVGACSASTVLDITSCQLDSGAIGCTPNDGALQIACGVGGRIRHRSSREPVAGATVALMGTESSSTVMTNDLGQFGFTAMDSGTWQLEPRKVGDVDGAVTALDAALILQSISGWRHLDSVQALVCDTTGNGQVTPLDAVRVLQFAVGQMNRLPVAVPCASDWAFIPDAPLQPNQEFIQPQFTATTCQQGSILFAPLLGNAPQEDFIAVPFGDCTGNWSAAAQQAHLRLARGDLRVRLGVARLRDGEWVLPLYLSSSQPFSALEARIVVETGLAPTNVRSTGVASDVMLRFEQHGTTLRLAMASAAPLNATGGPVALLTFDAASHPSGSKLAHLISAAVDEIDARIVD
jgi:hypothetical protein